MEMQVIRLNLIKQIACKFMSPSPTAGRPVEDEKQRRCQFKLSTSHEKPKKLVWNAKIVMLDCVFGPASENYHTCSKY